MASLYLVPPSYQLRAGYVSLPLLLLSLSQPNRVINIAPRNVAAGTSPPTTAHSRSLQVVVSFLGARLPQQLSSGDATRSIRWMPFRWCLFTTSRRLLTTSTLCGQSNNFGTMRMASVILLSKTTDVRVKCKLMSHWRATTSCYTITIPAGFL